MKFLNRVARWFAGSAGIVNAVVGAVITIVVVVILDTQVVPLLINGSDGGIGQTTLPLVQTALLIAGIFAAIGIIVYSAKHGLGGK